MKKLIVFVLICGFIYFGLSNPLKTQADTDFIGDGTYNFTCGQRIQLNNGVILETLCNTPYGINHVYFNAYDSNLNSLDQVGGFDQENLPRTNSYTLGSYSFRITINSISVNQNVFNISGTFLSTQTYCTSWTYSDWGSCVNNQTTRTILTSSPAGCIGGNPILYKSCPDANNTLYIGDGTYSLAQGDKIKLNNGITVEPIYSTTGSGDYTVYNATFKVYDNNSNYIGTSGSIRFGVSQALRIGNYIFQAYMTSVGKQSDNIWRSTMTLSSITNLYIGDGTYTFTDGQRVKLNNGVILEPVYSLTGSGANEFQNMSFKVYDSNSNYLGITDITRVNWTPRAWSFGGYIFQTFVSSMGTLFGNWSATISVLSLSQLPTCTSWSYSNWGTCTNGIETRTILSSSPINCTGGNPVLTQTCNPAQTCTSFTYSNWSTCNNGIQTRTIISSFPANCTGGILTQSCNTNSNSNLIYNINVITRPGYTKITWNSTEDDTTYLVYENPDNDSNIVSIKDDYTKNHEVMLNYLKPNTTYYFKINSKSGTGNMIESETFSFTTNMAWVTGKWIKTADSTTVYFIDSNNVRHTYPNNTIWRAYFGDDFSFVQTVTNDDLTKYSLGKNVPYERDRLIKIPSVPKVYKVADNGTIQWIKTESTAKRLYGDNWATLVHDLDESFFGDYTEGTSIE